MGIQDFLSSDNLRLDQQLKFTAEIDKMTGVLRRTMLVNGSRRENDAEHSWHIGVMTLLFKEYCVAPVDVEARMSIIREFMPEVYKWVEKNIDHAIEAGWVK